MKEINVKEINYNIFDLGTSWCLLSSGDDKGFNAMTISWGSFGYLWNKNIVTVYVRPSRYTKDFIDKTGYISLAFFDPKYKKELGRLGTVSGRDQDKFKDSPLHPMVCDNYIHYKEANMLILGKVLYNGPIISDGIVDKKIEEVNYKNGDYSYIVIAEIEKVLS